jgi:hypothetical protein
METHFYDFEEDPVLHYQLIDFVYQVNMNMGQVSGINGVYKWGTYLFELLFEKMMGSVSVRI